MSNNQIYLYLLAVEREFYWLLSKIGHFDPSTRAFTMTKELGMEIKRLNELWETHK
jgi:hypothetical protein